VSGVCVDGQVDHARLGSLITDFVNDLGFKLSDVTDIRMTPTEITISGICFTPEGNIVRAPDGSGIAKWETSYPIHWPSRSAS
jgi:hypothetical protein